MIVPLFYGNPEHTSPFFNLWNTKNTCQSHLHLWPVLRHIANLYQKCSFSSNLRAGNVVNMTWAKHPITSRSQKPTYKEWRKMPVWGHFVWRSFQTWEKVFSLSYLQITHHPKQKGTEWSSYTRYRSARESRPMILSITVLFPYVEPVSTPGAGVVCWPIVIRKLYPEIQVLRVIPA